MRARRRIFPRLVAGAVDVARPVAPGTRAEVLEPVGDTDYGSHRFTVRDGDEEPVRVLLAGEPRQGVAVVLFPLPVLAVEQLVAQLVADGVLDGLEGPDGEADQGFQVIGAEGAEGAEDHGPSPVACGDPGPGFGPREGLGSEAARRLGDVRSGCAQPRDRPWPQHGSAGRTMAALARTSDLPAPEGVDRCCRLGAKR